MNKLESLPRGFTLVQGEELFQIGTDSILLSEFSKIRTGDRVCDLCSGCGAVSVLLAMRGKGRYFDCVDINPRAAYFSDLNLRGNNMQGHAFTGDVKHVSDFLKPGAYDAAVSNPPYLRVSGYKPGPSPERDSARCELLCTISDVCAAGAYVLRPGGRFCVVYRADRISELLCAMSGARLEPKRLRFFCKNPSAKPSLALAEGVRNAAPGIDVLASLYSGSDEFKGMFL